MQIYVEAAVDGPHFVYTAKKLTAQMKFFTYIPLGKLGKFPHSPIPL